MEKVEKQKDIRMKKLYFEVRKFSSLIIWLKVAYTERDD